MAPRWLVYALVLLVLLALVPFALIARARVSTSTLPRLHLVFDMAQQPKFTTQSGNPLFADGRAMRPPVPGTVPWSQPAVEGPYWTGRDANGWITTFPTPVTEGLVRRGQERFDIFCSPCHGLSGYGDGPVAKRADALQEGTWVPPSSYHTDVVRQRPVGFIFNTITNGIRNMPSYGSQIPAADRWAIVAYVRALELSQDAKVDDVPPELRSQLR